MKTNTARDIHPTDRPPAAPWSRHLITTARLALGVPLVIFGSNGFLNFIPPPTAPLPEGAMAFAGALLKTGYMLPLIAVTQFVAGALLVANRFVPLALIMLAPFLVNAAAFHLVLEPSGLIVTGVFVALELFLIWSHRAAFRPLLAASWPRV